MVAVRTEKIAHTWADGIQALRGLDLDVSDGELVTVVGPSGAGKTTLLHVLAGLLRASTGRVLFDGQAVDRLAPRAREVALVLQGGLLLPHLTVRDNLAFGLRVRRVREDEVARRVAAAAAEIGLAALLDRWPADLSAGELHRAALGRAFVRQPRLLLLDEPLAALDPPLRHGLRDRLRALRARHPVTTFFVTHDAEEAMVLGDRVAVLVDGALRQVGSPDAVFLEPADLVVARLLGSRPLNLVRGRVTRTPTGIAVRGDLLEIPLEPHFAAWTGRDIVVGCRPEHVVVGAGDRPRLFEARIVRIDPVGARQDLALAPAAGGEWTAHLTREGVLHAGDVVPVSVAPDRLLCFEPESGRRLAVDRRSPA